MGIEFKGKTINEKKREKVKEKIVKYEKFWYITIWILGISFTIYLLLNIYLYLYKIDPIFNTIAIYGAIIYPIGIVNLIVHFCYLKEEDNDQKILEQRNETWKKVEQFESEKVKFEKD